jgi:cytochrome c oxidase subunit I
MKHFVARAENWLLLIPLLMWMAEKTFAGTSTLDIHLHDTYIVFTNASWGVIFLVLSLLPFMCQLLLRNKVTCNKTLLGLHVLLTCIIMVVFFCCNRFSYQGIAGTPRRYYDYTTWGDYYFNFSEKGILLLVLCYFMLQVLLLLYTAARLIMK